MARYLEKQNEERQKIERSIHAQAREQLASFDLATTPALVLANQGWHAGVIGIVASKLADQYARPVLMISLRKDALGLGSGAPFQVCPPRSLASVRRND